MAGPVRLLVIGNSGSGKSTLASRVGAALSIPVHDLDRLHWLSDGTKRMEADAQALTAEVSSAETWVIEGVYGWLAAVALPRATELVFLDLPWAACHAGLLRRGLRDGMTSGDQDALIAWAAAYPTRATSSSLQGHRALFARFEGPKARLISREAAAAFMPCCQLPAGQDP